jgi:hypothetical protein
MRTAEYLDLSNSESPQFSGRVISALALTISSSKVRLQHIVYGGLMGMEQRLVLPMDDRHL